MGQYYMCLHTHTHIHTSTHPLSSLNMFYIMHILYSLPKIYAELLFFQLRILKGKIYPIVLL